MSNVPASRSILRSLALCALVAAACGTCRPPLAGPVDCPIPTRPVRDEASCADWRWIGVLGEEHAGGPCPALDGWTVRPLFCPRAEPGPRRGGTQRPPMSEACEAGLLPAGLRPFCLYEHADRGADLEALWPESRALGLASITRDCMAVVPQASDLARRFLPDLQGQFLTQVGQAVQLSAGAGVRLAVLDTAPTNDVDPQDGPFSSPHGYTLINMARRLLCDPVTGPCPFRVTARLALAYRTFDPQSAAASLRDEVNGGYVGLVSDLAVAIREETVAWQASGEEHLVLNLSVGWRREVGGPDPTANQAVLAALRDSHCRGALAVAAAGNRDWGPEQKLHVGPLLPAAWEGLRTPTVAECEVDLEPGATQISDGPPGAYRPLLAAVGAVDAAGRALANARFEAEPRLVAFGDHGVVEGPRPSEPTDVLTGSSVSTLVGSATAAALWSADSQREPHAVLDELYAKGRDLGRRADFCQGDSPNEPRPCPDPALSVRRVYLCTTLGRECRRSSAAMAAAAAGAFPDAEVPRLHLRDLPGFESTSPLDAATLRKERSFDGCPPSWAPPFLATRPSGKAQERNFRAGSGPLLHPCPLWQLPGVYAEAALGPQPGSNPCPPCGFGTGSPGTLVIEIDPWFRGRLTAATLSVGNRNYSLDLVDRVVPGVALENLWVPPRAIVEDVPYEDGEPVLLSFVLGGNRSLVSPVLVAPRAPP